MPDPAATGGEELGLRIRMMRGKRAQKAVAEVAGITQGYLSEVETGKKIPSLPVLARIANAIGTTDAALLAGLALPDIPSPEKWSQGPGVDSMIKSSGCAIEDEDDPSLRSCGHPETDTISVPVISPKTKI